MLRFVSWLLEQLNEKYEIEHDASPLTAATTILSYCSRVGLAPETAAELTPTSLTAGYGRSVCLILDFLCEKVFEKIRLEKPKYPVGVKEYDQDIDPEESEEEEDIEEDDYYQENQVVEEMKDISFIQPTVDIEQWKLECERVASRLRIIYRDLTGAAILPTWHLHLETFRKESKCVAKESRKINSTLRQLDEKLSADIERIDKVERQLNLQSSNSQDEYETLMQERISIESNISVSQDKVDRDSEELSCIVEKLKERYARIEEHSAAVTNATPLKNMRIGLKALTDELRGLEMTIELTSNKIWRMAKTNGKPEDQLDNQEEEI